MHQLSHHECTDVSTAVVWASCCGLQEIHLGMNRLKGEGDDVSELQLRRRRAGEIPGVRVLQKVELIRMASFSSKQ